LTSAGLAQPKPKTGLGEALVIERTDVAGTQAKQVKTEFDVYPVRVRVFIDLNTQGPTLAFEERFDLLVPRLSRPSYCGTYSIRKYSKN